MKRFITYALSVMLLMGTLLLCSCNINLSIARPNTGIFYCEELGVTINFEDLNDFKSNCAVLHTKDGKCRDITMHTDYGRGMYFYDAEDDREFCIAEFKWQRKENVFRVTEVKSGKVYLFRYVNPDAREETPCEYCFHAEKTDK